METPIVWKNRPTYVDPVADKLVAVIVDLAQQVYILRDRQRILERLLQSKDVLHREELDGWQPAPDDQAELRRERDEFMSAVFRGLIEDVS